MPNCPQFVQARAERQQGAEERDVGGRVRMGLDGDQGCTIITMLTNSRPQLGFWVAINQSDARAGVRTGFNNVMLSQGAKALHDGLYLSVYGAHASSCI